MKIAIVLHQYLPRYTTGTELYVSGLARVLREQGVTVELFTGEDDGETFLGEKQYVHEGIPVHRFTHHPSLEPEPVLGEHHSALAEFAFGRFLDRAQPNAVHFFHLYGLGVGLMDAARARGIPYVVHLMDYWFLCPRTQMLDFEGALCGGPRSSARCARCAGDVDGNFAHLARFLDSEETLASDRSETDAGDAPAAPTVPGLAHVERRWPAFRDRLHEAARIIAPSAYLRDRFVDNGLAGDSVEVLPYGINRKLLVAPAREREAGRVRFGFLGNLATFKGTHVALEAFTRLEGTELRFRIHGDYFFREQDQMRACQALIEGDPRIEMRGPFDHRDVGAILAGLDAVVVPSLWHENTPFVVLEALQSGTPVIGSRVGGIEEVVRDGVTGLLFERGDAGDLERKMREFLASPLLDGVTPPEAPTLESNAKALVELYREIARETPERDAAVFASYVDDANARLFRVVAALAERFSGLGQQIGEDRDILQAIDEAHRSREQLDAHRRALEAHAARIRELETGLVDLEDHYREELAGRSRAIEELETDLDGHRKVVAEIRRELGERKQVEDELRSDLEEHRTVLASREAELKELGQVVSTLDQDLSGHRTALGHAEEELGRIREDRDAVRSHAADLEDRLRAQNEECGRLAARLDEARTLIDGKSATIEELGREIDVLHKEIDVLNEEIDATAQGRNL